MTDWKPAAQPANQSAFWDDQRSRRQIEATPDPIRRSYKLMWWVVLAFLILGGISIARAFAVDDVAREDARGRTFAERSAQ